MFLKCSKYVTLKCFVHSTEWQNSCTVFNVTSFYIRTFCNFFNRFEIGINSALFNTRRKFSCKIFLWVILTLFAYVNANDFFTGQTAFGKLQNIDMQGRPCVWYDAEYRYAGKTAFGKMKNIDMQDSLRLVSCRI